MARKLAKHRVRTGPSSAWRAFWWLAGLSLAVAIASAAVAMGRPGWLGDALTMLVLVGGCIVLGMHWVAVGLNDNDSVASLQHVQFLSLSPREFERYLGLRRASAYVLMIMGVAGVLVLDTIAVLFPLTEKNRSIDALACGMMVSLPLLWVLGLLTAIVLAGLGKRLFRKGTQVPPPEGTPRPPMGPIERWDRL